MPLYSSEIVSIARTDRYTGYEVVPGATVFNTTNLQQIQRVDADGLATAAVDTEEEG